MSKMLDWTRSMNLALALVLFHFSTVHSQVLFDCDGDESRPHDPSSRFSFCHMQQDWLDSPERTNNGRLSFDWERGTNRTSSTLFECDFETGIKACSMVNDVTDDLDNVHVPFDWTLMTGPSPSIPFTCNFDTGTNSNVFSSANMCGMQQDTTDFQRRPGAALPTPTFDWQRRERTTPSNLFYCDFELNSICTMLQDKTDQTDRQGQQPPNSFDWKVRSGTTPTGGTGPQTGAQGSRYYIFIEASDPQRAGDNARIDTPQLNFVGTVCVRWSYHMFGSDTGVLRMYSRFVGQNPVQRWVRSGEQGNAWLEAAVSVQLVSNAQTVGFEAIRGGDYKSDIAIDSVRVTAGDCGGGTVPSPVTTPPPPGPTTTTTLAPTTVTQPPQPVSGANVPYSCSFEQNDCQFNQVTTDRFDWTRRQGSTGTSETGPSAASTAQAGPQAAIFFCGFESSENLCGMIQLVNDCCAERGLFDWVRTSTGTPTVNTGPTGAQTGSWYMYIETSDPRQNGDNAIIETPIINAQGRLCLSFWYHMYGSDIGSFRVYAGNPGNNVFSVSGDRGNQWLQANVNVDIGSNQRIGFVGTRGTGIRSDIAIDNIRLTRNSCQDQSTSTTTTTTTPPTTTAVLPGSPAPVPTTTPAPQTTRPPVVNPGNLPYLCNFENIISCGITQRTNDNFDWTLQRGPTATANTGPGSGRNSATYFYIETSSPQQPGNVAEFETPPFQYNGPACLEFYYHMFGSDINELRVYLRSRGLNSIITQRNGAQGNQWVQQRSTINNFPFNDRIVFRGVRGNGIRGDIALDDISVTAGACPGLQPPTTTPAPATVIRDLFRCNAEGDGRNDQNCRIRQDAADNFDWTLGTGQTPSGTSYSRRINGQLFPVTGPRRAREGTFYLYTEASGRNNGDVARLRFEGNQFRRGGQNCLRFSYNMNGFHIGTLNVYNRVGGQRVSKWTLSGDQYATSQNWQDATVEMDMNGVSEVGIEATMDGSFNGDIAIDNIRMDNNRCRQVNPQFVWQCDFEPGNICDMQQSTTDVFDWTLKRGPTPSRDTGPTSASNGQYYIYIEASTPRRPNDQATIFLPRLNINGQYCMIFRYHAYGYHMGTLSLITIRNGEETLRWSISGQSPLGSLANANRWLEQRQTIDNVQSNDRIAFRGIRGSAFSSDAALDDIRLQRGRC